MREPELADDVDGELFAPLTEECQGGEGLLMGLGRELREAHGLGRDPRVREMVHDAGDDLDRRALVDELQHARRPRLDAEQQRRRRRFVLGRLHTIFGYVTSGQNVVDAIEQNDEIKKLIIVRKGEEAKKFDAVKTFSDYFANKGEDDKKQAAIQAEARAKQVALETEAKKVYDEKYAPVKADKVKYLAGARATASKSTTGLETKMLQTGTGKKPTDGSTIYIHYAGYLEDGSLFDSSYEEVNKLYGKFDANRASQNGYQPFPFEAGKKEGLIPGFLEGISNLSFGDKALLFIPSNLGYGERGAGNVIPPNSNIIFEVELFETMPTAEPKK